MAEDLILARVGFAGATAGLRRRILRNQGNTVYDIHLIHYGWIDTDVLNTNEVDAMAVSTRNEDQVNDTTTIGFDDMVTEEGIFGAVALLADLQSNGGVGLISGYNIPFPKPYTVHQLAGLFNSAIAVAGNNGIDVWFVRRDVTPMEKASLVARLGGGRARTE